MDGLETRSVFPADLEYRQRGRLILGFFPYGHPATISDRGRVRKEQFAARAFQYAVDTPDHRVDLLRGHDFDNPLASKQAGTLKLEDSDAGLNFRATLPPEKRQPTWMRDTVLALGAGLLSGISPGFKLPPRNRIAKAEEEVPEKGNPGVFVRLIRAAVLFELSLVARPAYLATKLALRADENPELDELRRSDRIVTPNSDDRYRIWL